MTCSVRPEVSIIISTLNAQEFIGHCLTSCYGQLRVTLEVIVVDGGSSDSTGTITRSLLRPTDTYVTLHGSSIYDAWNHGICTSKGSWIVFLGADDSWSSPYSLSSMLNIALAGDHKFVSCCSWLFSRSAIPFTERLRARGSIYSRRKHLSGKLSISHPGSLYSRKLFDRYGLFDTSYTIVADSEHLLRCNITQAGFISLCLVNVTEGGVSMNSKYCHHAELLRLLKAYPCHSNLYARVSLRIQLFLMKLIQNR